VRDGAECHVNLPFSGGIATRASALHGGMTVTYLIPDGRRRDVSLKAPLHER